MARRREGTIREEVHDLQALVGQYHGQRELRLKMLLMLLEKPHTTDIALATELNVGERTIRRWWQTYRSEGLRGLLSVHDESTNAVSFSFPAMRKETTGDVSERFARFLNTLPMSFDSDRWVTQLKEGLSAVLDGVDRVTVAVNLGSDVDAPDGREVGVMINRSAVSGRESERVRAFAANTQRTGPGETLVAQARSAGVMLTDYHPPHYFDFYAQDEEEYVGTLIIWSLKSGPPTPRATVELIRSLHGFFTFLLSDCVARQIRRDPAMRLFKDVITAIAWRIGLTGRQLEIFTLQMLGYDRDRIAEDLKIARGTVNKHVGAIHEKAGTANYNELLSRFFSPLGDD